VNNTFVIIAIVGAFIVGGISANPIADAVKPLTEIIVANDQTNPIPVQDASSPISLRTGIFPGSITCGNNPPVVDDVSLQYGYFGEPDESNGFFSGSNGELVLVGATLTKNDNEFELRGIVDSDTECNLIYPTVFTITGQCGVGSPIYLTTDSGISIEIQDSVVACP
jgi:hypothetical protein